MAQNLKVNDQVKIIAGDHKGETAKIVKMDRKNHKAARKTSMSVSIYQTLKRRINND